MAKINLKNLKIEAKKEIKKAVNLKELDKVFKKHLGKRGKLSQIFLSFKKLPTAKKAKMGKELNELKDFVKKEIENKAKKLRRVPVLTQETERIDITLPGRKPVLDHLHPLTLVKRKTEEILCVNYCKMNLIGCFKI